ncbi:MAG: glucose-6-phosphate isomerase, partial [Pseudomonadota bacterium]|nr:glucose-6-phosphate isomerase [Pseudomonadota bacterium]
NLPAIKALLAKWNYNFIGTLTIAVLPYERYLKRPPACLQLLTMECNGKHVARVDYQTSPSVWGEPGTNGQHSFCHLIHQGTRMVPRDRLTNTLIRRHRRLRRRLS